MITFISVIIILTCVLLVLVVLIQSPRGGIDAAFGTPTQLFGVRRTADFLEKTTWVLVGILLFLSLVTTNFMSGTTQDSEAKSEIEEHIQDAQPIQNVPNVPQEIPQPQK